MVVSQNHKPNQLQPITLQHILQSFLLCRVVLIQAEIVEKRIIHFSCRLSVSDNPNLEHWCQHQRSPLPIARQLQQSYCHVRRLSITWHAMPWCLLSSLCPNAQNAPMGGIFMHFHEISIPLWEQFSSFGHKNALKAYKANEPFVTS